MGAGVPGPHRISAVYGAEGTPPQADLSREYAALGNVMAVGAGEHEKVIVIKAPFRAFRAQIARFRLHCTRRFVRLLRAFPPETVFKAC